MPTAGAVPVFLAEADPYDPVTDATIPVRVTTAELWQTSSLDTPASTQYWPGLKVEEYGSSILGSDGTPGGIVDAKSGQIVIPASHRNWDQLLRCSWHGRTVTVYKVAPFAAHSARTIEVRGYVSGVTFGRTELRLSLESFNAKLRTTDVQSAKYWGRPRCLRFGNATTDRVEIADTGDKLDMTGSFSVECLFRATAAPAGLRYLFHKVNAGAGYYLGINASLQVVLSHDGTTQTFSASTLTAGRWYLISAVWDTTANQTRIYLDGVLDQQADKTGDPVNVTTSAFMGNSAAAATNSCYGDIAELRLWNVAKTQNEILRRLYGGINRQDAGLVWWWQGTYDSGNATVAYDDSYSKTNGTISSAGLWNGTYEGDATLGGSYKPWALGKCYYAEPQLIDAQKLIYQVCSRGFDPDRTPLFWDGAASIPLAGTPTSTDLWNATVAAGSVVYEVATGRFRLGSAPALALRVTFTAAPYSSTTTLYPTGAMKAIVCESAGFAGSDYSVADTDFAGFFAKTGLVTYVASSSAGGIAGNTSAVSISLPAGAAVGDLVILLGSTHNTTPYGTNDWTLGTPTVVGGTGTWTLITSGADGGIAHRAAAWRHVVTSGETGASCPITSVAGTSPNRNFLMVLLRGHNGTTPVVDSAEYSPAGATTTAIAPSVVTDTSGDLMLSLWTTNNITNYSQPAGMTQAVQRSQTGGGGNACHSKVAYESRETAGTTGTRTITMASAYQACISVAVGVQLSGSAVLAAQHGIYVKAGGMKCDEALARILQSYRAWGGFDYDGIFRSKDLTASTQSSTPSEALGVDQYRGIVIRGILHPVKEVFAGWRPYWPPYGDGEVAGSVTVDTRWDVQQAYRTRRFPKVVDRFGRKFDPNYKDDAIEIAMETLLVDEWACAEAAQAVQALRDCMVPIWACEILDPDYFPKVGSTASITGDCLGLSASPVKCVVGSATRSISEGYYRCYVELVDATSIAVAGGGEE